ncbi:MAG: ribose-phosphate diphosphokinase [Gammaproteobacteria bacterium]|jgi:ribose-phosphate pyrophosphokinase
MMGLTVHAMPGNETPAQALARLLDAPCHSIAVRAFPDGESLVTVEPVEGTAVVYCTLGRPNDKLVEIMLASSAFRANGATRLVLVAPYMCYMRQDAAFAPGQAVSQRAVGRFLAGLFDRIVTVDPHLHRQKDIAAIFPDTDATAVSAAPALAAFLHGPDGGRTPILVGPDEESRQWVEAVAAPLGLDVLTAAKTRRGDADVSIVIPDVGRVAGRPAVLVDDVISTGATLARCAELLVDAGATAVDAIAVHCLCDDGALVAMRNAGIGTVVTTDSVAHPTNAIALAPLLAEALKEETGA